MALHRSHAADLTILCQPCSEEEAEHYGIAKVWLWGCGDVRAVGLGGASVRARELWALVGRAFNFPAITLWSRLGRAI